MIAYKFLRDDGMSVFSGFRWPLPDSGPGAWVEAPIEPCRTGIHTCRPADMPYWAGRHLYEIELDGEIVERPSQLIASRGRLLRPIRAWDEGGRDAYTRMCADRGHQLAAPPLEQWRIALQRSLREGPALLGFIAARIAEERGGPQGYRAERARQAAWLAEQLGLPHRLDP